MAPRAMGWWPDVRPGVSGTSLAELSGNQEPDGRRCAWAKWLRPALPTPFPKTMTKWWKIWVMIICFNDFERNHVTIWTCWGWWNWFCSLFVRVCDDWLLSAWTMQYYQPTAKIWATAQSIGPPLSLNVWNSFWSDATIIWWICRICSTLIENWDVHSDPTTEKRYKSMCKDKIPARCLHAKCN